MIKKSRFSYVTGRLEGVFVLRLVIVIHYVLYDKGRVMMQSFRYTISLELQGLLYTSMYYVLVLH